MPDLELQLRELGGELAYPPTPDLVRPVRERLERRRPATAWLRRRTVAIAFAALVVAAGAVMAVPTARTAILDWLGVRGVSIEFVDRLPEVPAEQKLGLGERTTLESARRRAPYGVLLPHVEGLEEPDVVYFSNFWQGQPTTFVFGTLSDVRVLMTQFLGRPLIEKQVEAQKKVVGSGTRVESVTVNGGRGVWLSGAPHTFVYVDEDGEVQEETLRLARNTLLWERGDLTVRIEGAFTKRQALEIARSVR